MSRKNDKMDLNVYCEEVCIDIFCVLELVKVIDDGMLVYFFWMVIE